MKAWPKRSASGGSWGPEERKIEPKTVRPRRPESSQQASSNPDAVQITAPLWIREPRPQPMPIGLAMPTKMQMPSPPELNRSTAKAGFQLFVAQMLPARSMARLVMRISGV